MGGTFRADLAAYLDDETIDRAVDRDRPMERVRRHDGRSRYSAFCDPSGGRHDAFAICVGHREGTGNAARFVADVVRARRPPFDPQEVVREYCALLKEFGLKAVRGDRYAAEWVVAAFQAHGVAYTSAEKTKSDLYLEALPLFTRGLVSIRSSAADPRASPAGETDPSRRPRHRRPSAARKRRPRQRALRMRGAREDAGDLGPPASDWAFPKDESISWRQSEINRTSCRAAGIARCCDADSGEKETEPMTRSGGWPMPTTKAGLYYSHGVM